TINFNKNQMLNTVTKVTTTSWISRVMSSIFGVILGIFMFFGSFYLLYWNEGRVNVANIARTAVEVPASGDVSAELDKSAVYTSGNLISAEQLGDEYLVAGDYLVIQRNVEMFSWE